MSFSGISNLVTSLISRINPTNYNENGIAGGSIGEAAGAFFCLIGQSIVSWFYHICKWFLAFVDFLQYFIQKLIGLDYWLNSTKYTLSGATKNDILFSFLFDDTVQRVFRAMLAVFFVLLIIFTIFQIVRQEWQYITGEKFGDGKGNSKTAVIRSSLKAIAIVILFPIILVIGVVSSNAILASLVKALNIDMSSTFGSTLFYISSQNASKYRNYADSGRIATSDQVTFYMIFKDRNGNVLNDGNGLYLEISSSYGPGSSGNIRYADFQYERIVETEPVAYQVCYEDYLAYINGEFSSDEKFDNTNDEIENSSGAVVRKYTVNSMFDIVNPMEDGLAGRMFSGYCIGLDINSSRAYYLVRAKSNIQLGMYYYLHNVLNVPIMNFYHNLNNTKIYSNLVGRMSPTTGYISSFNVGAVAGSGAGISTDDAAYNTWFYSTIYMKTFSFETSETTATIRNNNATGVDDPSYHFLERIGFNADQRNSASVYYNGSDYSMYFDGGQLGNVQLQSEYYVMADVIDFMLENDVGLYMLNITSTSIKWDYNEYNVDPKWISSYASALQKDYYVNGSNVKARDLTYNTLPFVVSYSDDALESGDILYMSNYDANSEIDGANYIMCWKIVENGTVKFIPLVNGKTFRDPTTNKTYRFSSDYLSSNYRGVVIAKGTFDVGVDTNDGTRGNPTYLRNYVRVSSDGRTDYYGINETAPYYYDMKVSGNMSATPILSTNHSSNGRVTNYTTTNYDITGLQATPMSGDVGSSATTYEGMRVEDPENSNPKYVTYKFKVQGDSENKPININQNIIKNLKISLAGTNSAAEYAGSEQKVSASLDGTGENKTYLVYLFTVNNYSYFRVLYDVSDNAVLFELFDLAELNQEEQETVKIPAIVYKYDIVLTYQKVGDPTIHIPEPPITGISINEFRHSPSSNENNVNRNKIYELANQNIVVGGEKIKDIMVYLDSEDGKLVSLSGEIGVDVEFGNHILPVGPVIEGLEKKSYDVTFYTFYLYNYFTGYVKDGNNGRLYEFNESYDRGYREITELPGESYQTTVKINAEDFIWDNAILSYNLYNGNSYIATLYKTPSAIINSLNDITSQTTRVLFDNGKTYYNMQSMNSFDYLEKPAGIEQNAEVNDFLSYYRSLQKDITIECARDKAHIDFGKLDINISFDFILNSKVRFFFSFGPSSMQRGQVSQKFYLNHGIKFDYMFADTSTVEFQTFYIATKISYWILLISAILIIKVLSQAIWGVIKRFYTITLYFLAMPAVASTIPLNNDKFKNSIQDPLFKEVLGTYGVILGINVFFILLMPVKSISQIFTEADLKTSGTFFLTHLPFTYKILNLYVYILFVLVAFTMIQSLPQTISTMLGSNDVHSEGAKVKEGAMKSIKSAADTWSGRDLMNGIKETAGMASNIVPGAAVFKDGAKAIGGIIGWGKEMFGKKDEDYEGDGGDEEGSGSSDGGSSRESSEVEEGEEGEASNEAVAENEAQGMSVEDAITEMTGLDAAAQNSRNDAEKAAYEAAQSMVEVTEEEQAEMDEESFNRDAAKGEGSADTVVGNDYNAASARMNALKNSGVNDFELQNRLVNSDNINNADYETKKNAYRASLSDDKRKEFESKTEEEQKADVDKAKFGLSENGIVTVDGKELEGAMAKNTTAAMVGSAYANMSDEEKSKALDREENRDLAEKADAAISSNIAAGVDFSKDSGLADRIINHAMQDENLRDDALFNLLKNDDNFLKKYHIAKGEDGTIDEEGLRFAIANNRDKINVDDNAMRNSMKEVLSDKVKKGEYKVSAWDLQKEADSSVLDAYRAQKQAERDALDKHSVLDGATAEERTRILSMTANKLEGTALGDKILQTIGKDSLGGMLSDDELKKLDEAGLTELLARTATIDKTLREAASKINKKYAENVYVPKTAEELAMEQEMGKELFAKQGDNAMAVAFANSDIEGKNLIANGAIKAALDANGTSDVDALIGAENVLGRDELQDLGSKGFSNSDIELAYKAAEAFSKDGKVTKAALNESLEKMRDNPSAVLGDILADKKLGAEASKYINENLTIDQKNQISEQVAASGMLGMGKAEQYDALYKLALKDGAILEQVGSDKKYEVLQWLNKNEDAKNALMAKASDMSYLELKGEVNNDELREAVNKKRLVDEIMKVDSGSVTSSDISAGLKNAGADVQKAFIDAYVDKAGIISGAESEEIRKKAVADYLTKAGKSATDVDIAKALSEDAGAMMAADDAITNEAKNRLALGLGGRTKLIADAVADNKRLSKKAAEEFRKAHPGLELDDADELTRNAFLAKYEGELSNSTIEDVNEQYLKQIEKAQGFKLNINERGSLLAAAHHENIDKLLMKTGKLKPQDLINSITSNDAAFASVFDTLNRQSGQEGVDIINAVKRSVIADKIKGIDEATIRAGLVIDPSTLSGNDRRDFDYNKGILTREVMQGGRTDLLQNIFNNTEFIGKDKIQDRLSKGESFGDILKSNEALQDKLLSLGAKDMTLSITKDKLESKEAEAVKASPGLKNDLLEYIKKNLDDKVSKFEDIKPDDLKKAISELKNNSSTFNKALHDKVVADVSYAGNASEEDKNRFFESEELNTALLNAKNAKKPKNVKDAFNIFLDENGNVANGDKNVLFKVPKKLPKQSSAYDNWNKAIQIQISAVERDNSLTRSEKDAKINGLEAKKIYTQDPENYSQMSAEEQRAFKEQQQKNKAAAINSKNYTKLVNSKRKVKVATGDNLKKIADENGNVFTYVPASRSEATKKKHEQQLANAAADISRYRSASANLDNSVFDNYLNFDALVESYGLNRGTVAALAMKLKENNSKYKNNIGAARKAALEQILNERYRIASKKVAKDKGESAKGYFDGYGIGMENVRVKEANTKYLQVQSRVAGVTGRRMKLVDEVEQAIDSGKEGDISKRKLKRYDKIYGKKTQESAIRAQNDLANARNMLKEMQNFNSTFKNDKSQYLQELRNHFEQKFGKDITNRLLGKLKESSMSKHALSIQKRDIERMLLEEMNQQQKRTLYPSKVVPARESVAGEFIGQTLTNAKTQTQVANDRMNADNLNKMLRQIENQKNLVKWDENQIKSVIGAFNWEKLVGNRKFKSAGNDAVRYDLLQGMLRKELELANNRVHNNSFTKDRKAELQKLNGIYVDRSEITRAVDAATRQALRTVQDPIYKRLEAEYRSSRNLVRNQEHKIDNILTELNKLKNNTSGSNTEIRKLTNQLRDQQQLLTRLQDNLKASESRYNAKLDSFVANGIANYRATGAVTGISSNATVGIKFNPKISEADRKRINREVQETVRELARKTETALRESNNKLTSQMNTRIRDILNNYNFNRKLAEVPGLMNKLKGEIDREITQLTSQNSTKNSAMIARLNELKTKLSTNTKAYENKLTEINRKYKNLLKKVKELESKEDK